MVRPTTSYSRSQSEMTTATKFGGSLNLWLLQRRLAFFLRQLARDFTQQFLQPFFIFVAAKRASRFDKVINRNVSHEAFRTARAIMRQEPTPQV